jgi:tetratricopeptide (TPR) repeat protein
MLKPLALYLFCLSIAAIAVAQPSNKPVNSYYQGIELKKAQKYAEALAAFKEAIEKKENYSDALYEAAWICDELKDFKQGIIYLQEATQVKPSPTNYFELAYAYDNSGQKDSAKENYRKVLELYPKYYDADRALGDIFYDEGNYETALNYYKKYFESSRPAEPYYYYTAAWCSNYLKDYADAILYLEKYEPHSQKEFAKKYTEMGYTYFMLGYNDDAINAYQNALTAYPNNGDALRGLADVYYNNLEDYSNALKYYNLALQYDEQNSKDCYYKTGWIYVQQKKYDSSITALQKAADYDPKDATTREQIGYAYFMLNKYDTAIIHFNKAIELNADSKISYYYKGFCYADLNQNANAMDAYDHLKPLDKNAADGLLKEIKQKEKYFKSLAAANKKSKKQTDGITKQSDATTSQDAKQ